MCQNVHTPQETNVRSAAATFNNSRYRKVPSTPRVQPELIALQTAVAAHAAPRGRPIPRGEFSAGGVRRRCRPVQTSVIYHQNRHSVCVRVVSRDIGVGNGQRARQPTQKKGQRRQHPTIAAFA